MPIWYLVLSFLFCYIMGDLGVPVMLASLLSLSLIVAPAVGVLADDSSTSTSEVSSDTEYVSPYEEWLRSFYDESNGTVYLNSDVLNSYKFPHLANFLKDSPNLSGLDLDYSFGDISDWAQMIRVVEGDVGAFTILWESDDYDFSLNQRGVWTLKDINQGAVEIDFPDGFNVHFTTLGTNVDSLVSSLRTDLVANNPFSTSGTTLVPMIVDILVSGLVGLGSGLGIGISSFAQSLAIADGSLSIYFVLVLVFAGVAVAIGLTTKIFNWLSSLGAN